MRTVYISGSQTFSDPYHL